MDVRGRDYLFVILASVFWGTAFPATKFIVDAVDPLLITAARLGMGALLGFGILAALRRLDWHFLRDPLVWVLGLLNALAFNLQNVGLVYTTASKTALLVNVNVVFIAILMAAVYKERVTGPRALGILLGLGGVVVLATKLNPAALVGGEFLGDALVFGSGLVWSFYILGVKVEVDRGGDYIALTATVLATTTVFAVLPLLAVPIALPSTALSWGVVAYLGLVPTFVPMLLYTLSLRTISPTVSSLLVLLEIIVAAALAVLLFGEVLDGFTLVGGALILLGTYVTTIGEQPIPEPGAAGLANVPADPAATRLGESPRR